MTIESIFAKGGPVVWILLGYSLLAVTILIERLIHFGLQGRPPRNFDEQLQLAMKAGNTDELISSAKGPEVIIIRALLDAAKQGVKDLNRVAVRVGSEQLQAMERGFRTLGVLGNTAPLLGLFGTITGMIKAFMVIEQAGGRVDAQALAGGIWEAMLTTGVGLAVAIPILLLLHALEGMADRRAQAMRRYASVVLEQIPHDCAGESEEAVHHADGVIHAV